MGLSGRAGRWFPGGEWVWFGVLLVILVLGVAWPFKSQEDPHDSLSDAPTGKLAFYRVVERLSANVERNLLDTLQTRPEVDTLCILGPARYPTRTEWRRLHDWVDGGGSLLFAGRRQDPAVTLHHFGIEITPRASTALKPVVQTELVEGELEWRSSAEVDGPLSSEVLVSLDGSTQVLIDEVGAGYIIVCASDAAFTNAVVGRANNGELAVRIFDECATREFGPVVFDESLNQSGTPAVVRLMFGVPLRHLSLQALLWLVLFWWMGFYRFGSPIPEERHSRRDFAEHARALGHLHSRCHDVRSLVRTFYEYFRRRLGLRRKISPDLLAGRSGRSVESVRKLIAELENEAPLSPGEGARLIKSLSKLQQRIGRR